MNRNRFPTRIHALWVLIFLTLGGPSLANAFPASACRPATALAFGERTVYSAEELLSLPVFEKEAVLYGLSLGADEAGNERVDTFFSTFRNIVIEDGKIGKLPLRQIANGGNTNLGVYEFPGANGKPRILKILKTDAGKYYRGNLMQQLYGSFLGERFDGPHIYDFGVVTKKETGERNFYVVMDKLFPGEEAYSWKDSADKQMLKRSSDGKTVTYVLAEKIFGLMAKGIIPQDPDILFNKDGDVKWIDTTFWRRASGDNDLKTGFQRLIVYVLLELRNKPETFKEFLTASLHLLKQSDRFSDSEKEEFVEGFVGFRKDFSELLIKSRIISRGMPAVSNPIPFMIEMYRKTP